MNPSLKQSPNTTTWELNKKMFVLTTIDELPNEPVIMSLDHVFYQKKKEDIILNLATVEANFSRLLDITSWLGWGEHTVYQLTD